MALSADEQRLLDQLEESLRAEDPALARKLEGHPDQLPSRRWAVAALCFVAGVALLVVGMLVNFSLSVFGFLVMFAGVAVIMIHPSRAGEPAKTDSADEPSGGRS